MVSFFSSLRTTLAIALLCLPHSALAQREGGGYFGPGANSGPPPGPEHFKCTPWHPPETCAVVRSYGEIHYRAGTPKYGNAKRKAR